MIGAAITLFFIALSWLTPQQQDAVANFLNAAVPYMFVLICASVGAAIAGASVEEDEEEAS
jgi:hypothetical protein